MNFDEEFQKTYRNEFTLPEKLSETYSIVSCLKYSDERQIYVLKDRNGKKFVLKTENGDDSTRLENEYRIASLIIRSQGQEGVPKPVMLLREDSCTYYIREYIEGKTIRDIIEKNGCLSEKQTRSVAYSLCSVLEKIHSLPERIICRDIKPENIVIADDGRCFLIDLDAARSVKKDHTNDTVCLGTRTTAAPEQFGFGQTDERTDVYAVGMLMLYMMSGDYDKNELPNDRTARIIRRSTRFDPNRRYSDISDLKSALDQNKRSIRIALFSAASAVLIAAAAVFLCARSADVPEVSAPVSITEAPAVSAEPPVTAESEIPQETTTAQETTAAPKTTSAQETSAVTESKKTSFTAFLTAPAGEDEVTDMYRAINPDWVLNGDGSYTYTCTPGNDGTVFRLLPEEYCKPEDMRCAFVTVSAQGAEVWTCLTAPDRSGEWFCSTPMCIKENRERVIFRTPDGISSGLILCLNELTSGASVTVSDIAYSDSDYNGADVWNLDSSGNYTFTKDTVTSLAFFPETGMEQAEIGYVYADVEVTGEMVCGIAGYNENDGFTYCNGFTVRNEKKRLCWDLKHGLSNGRISHELSFDCYFYSDDLTAKVSNIVFSEKPIIE